MMAPVWMCRIQGRPGSFGCSAATREALGLFASSWVHQCVSVCVHNSCIHFFWNTRIINSSLGLRKMRQAALYQFCLAVRSGPF